MTFRRPPTTRILEAMPPLARSLLLFYWDLKDWSRYDTLKGMYS